MKILPINTCFKKNSLGLSLLLIILVSTWSVSIYADSGKTFYYKNYELHMANKEVEARFNRIVIYYFSSNEDVAKAIMSSNKKTLRHPFGSTEKLIQISQLFDINYQQ